MFQSDEATESLHKPPPLQIRRQCQMPVRKRLNEFHRPRIHPMLFAVAFHDQILSEFIVFRPVHASHLMGFAHDSCLERKCQFVSESRHEPGMLFIVTIRIHRRVIMRRIDFFRVELFNPVCRQFCFRCSFCHKVWFLSRRLVLVNCEQAKASKTSASHRNGADNVQRKRNTNLVSRRFIKVLRRQIS